MIPHVDNEMTRHMNPLKLYVYLSLHVPVVTTPIANIEDLAEFVEIGDGAEEFVAAIDACLQENPLAGRGEELRELMKANSWNVRVADMLELIESEFAKREAALGEMPALPQRENWNEYVSLS